VLAMENGNRQSQAWSRRAQTVAVSLAGEYGLPRHGNYADPTDELFFALLSKKTPPSRYITIFKRLRREFRPWGRLLTAPVARIEEVLRPLGLGRTRAGQIRQIAERINADFSRVSLAALRQWSPDLARSYLKSLPGVGEKIARCVMLYSLGHDWSPMDTHAIRVMTRLGLLPTGVSAGRAHTLMDERLPRGLSYAMHVGLVAHGRAVCRAKRALCDGCILVEVCPGIGGGRRAHASKCG